MRKQSNRNIAIALLSGGLLLAAQLPTQANEVDPATANPVGGVVQDKAEEKVDRQTNRIADKTEQKIDQTTDSAVDKAFDRLLGKVFGK